ncbi:MAG: S-layer homology domain-containing protein [Muricomes sp.]
MRKSIIELTKIACGISMMAAVLVGRGAVVHAEDETFTADSIQTSEASAEPQGEPKENSWRFDNGELIPTIETYAEVSNAWRMVNGVYINSMGNAIPGAVRKGIDVSEHQGKIDWNKVKADGIDFVIIRCGYGSDEPNQVDKDWIYNVTECERLRIPYGVFIYSYATDTNMAKSEANHVLRLIQGHNLSYPVYFDMEDGSTENTSAEMKGNMAKVFCDTVSAAGYDVGIYANLDWWNTYLTSPVFDNSSWSKWIAQYNTTCDYSGKYDIWQCTSSGKVDGINGNVDVDFWTGLPYTDVRRQGWYYNAVQYMYENGIMTGLDSSTFGPSQKISRAQFVTILYRMSGSPDVSYSAVFPDVSNNQFYTDAVLWASAQKIAMGYENGRFGPADNVTREQMMTILHRYAQYKGYDITIQGDCSGFRDVNRVSTFAKTAVQWCVGAGVIKGNGDGTLAPQDHMDRASCATAMMRYLEDIGR